MMASTIPSPSNTTSSSPLTDKTDNPQSEHEKSETRIILSQQALVPCLLALSKLDLNKETPRWKETTSSTDCITSENEVEMQTSWTRMWFNNLSSEYKTLRQDFLSTLCLLDHAFEAHNSETGDSSLFLPEFIGSAKCLKKLFTLPYTENEISLMIHRVGKSLLVHSLQDTEHVRLKNNKFLFDKTYAFSTAWCKELKKLKNTTSDGGISRNEESKYKDTQSNKDMESKLLYYTTTAAASSSARAKRKQTYRTYNGGFRRTLRWRFQDMSLLVGSNLLLCQDENLSETEFSIRLHDRESAITKSQCLDYYLDNRLAGVDTLALCLHSGGVLVEYRLIRTEEIPLLAERQFSNENVTHRRNFKHVEKRATSLFKFLSERCHPEKSYWLHKESGKSNLVGLFELNGKTSEQRWIYNMAMLCYRVAQGYTKCDTEAAMLRHRELLLKCLELLDDIANSNGPPRYILRAALHEQVANNYFKSVTIYGKEKYAKKKALRAIDFALAHWRNVKTFLDEESKRESLVDDDLNGVILQFYFRMEKQVLACHVQICLEHTSQKQFVLGAELLIEGMSNALISKSKPSISFAANVLADTLLAISKLVVSKDLIVTSSVTELLENVQMLSTKLSSTVNIARNEEIVSNQDISDELIIAQKLCVNALWLLQYAKIENNSKEQLDSHIGNCWNELGKLRLTCGSYTLAKEAFESGLRVFHKRGDVLNILPCLCNLNHLERSLGFAKTQIRQISENSLLPFDRAIEHMKLALNMVQSLKNSKSARRVALLWEKRINLELAMTRLIFGCQTIDLFKQYAGFESTRHENIAECHKSIIEELHRAIEIYEHYMETDDFARKQAAAVHFHLGLYYKWCTSSESNIILSFCKNNHKRLKTLGERHLKMALNKFERGSPEYEQCLLELK